MCLRKVFPWVSTLISPKVAHFPYKLFYSLLSCCLFRLLVSLSRSALRSLLSRPFLICSYRDRSRLRAFTKKSQLQLVCHGQITLPAGNELVLSPVTFLKCQGINLLSFCPLLKEMMVCKARFRVGNTESSHSMYQKQLQNGYL